MGRYSIETESRLKPRFGSSRYGNEISRKLTSLNIIIFISSVLQYCAISWNYCKKTSQFKTLCKDDCCYITQLKQQISKRCYYLAAYRSAVNVLTSNSMWSFKGALNVLLQSFSSTLIYHIRLQNWAFSCIYGHFQQNFTAHVQKWLFMNYRGKFRHHCLIPQPDFLYSAKFLWFGNVFHSFLHFICWKSAIFLLPVCLTYWPRKYATRVNPTCDNFDQVWCWQDHPLPSYSVLVADKLRDFEQLSYMAGHVTNPATKFEDLAPIRSSVMSYNVSHWLLWKCVRGHCMRWITFLESPTPICLFTIQLWWRYNKGNSSFLPK